MKRSLRVGCIVAALALTIGGVVGSAHAEEGAELTLSDATVTAGRAFVVSGDGCDPGTSRWVFVTVDDIQRLVPTNEGGVWSAEFQVGNSTSGGKVPVSAQCGLTDDGWDYAPTTVEVTFDGEYGLEVEPRLWLSHPVVTAGYVLAVSGLGCSSEVRVQVGDRTESVIPTTGDWRARVLIPEGTLGDVPVTATCAGDDTVVYPASVMNVVAAGNLGFPPIPDAGGGNPAPSSPAPSYAATTSTLSDKPGLPHTGW